MGMSSFSEQFIPRVNWHRFSLRERFHDLPFGAGLDNSVAVIKLVDQNGPLRG
jgi:hypothetical protein